MKLTRRQEEFISNLVELNQKMDGPIHYTILADHLGVSPFTAYDMLRLLEEKGVVSSEYQLASDKSGPGRAERVFYPTKSALDHRQRLAEDLGNNIKPIILEQLHNAKSQDQEILHEMLARIPPMGQGQIRYCVEVMTIVALRLRQCPGISTFQTHLPEILPASAPTNKANLNLLGGFAFGILSMECTSDGEWLGKLFEHVGHYLEIVATLDTAEGQKLGEYLKVVFTPIMESGSNH